MRIWHKPGGRPRCPTMIWRGDLGVKTVRLAVLVVIILGSASCSSWQWPDWWPYQEEEEPAIDYLGTPVRSFQMDLQRAQERQVAANVRKAQAREAFEKLRQEYNQASDTDRPNVGMQLAAAQAEYIHAQNRHVESRRELEMARRAYIRKLILDKNPALALESLPAEGSPVATGVSTSAVKGPTQTRTPERQGGQSQGWLGPDRP